MFRWKIRKYFLEGLSLRGVFEFGGRSHLLGLQIALNLSKNESKGVSAHKPAIRGERSSSERKVLPKFRILSKHPCGLFLLKC